VVPRQLAPHPSGEVAEALPVTRGIRSFIVIYNMTFRVAEEGVRRITSFYCLVRAKCLILARKLGGSSNNQIGY